jgi:hypothetical protein
MTAVMPMHTLLMRGNFPGLRVGAEAAAASRLPSESPSSELPSVDIAGVCDGDQWSVCSVLGLLPPAWSTAAHATLP